MFDFWGDKLKEEASIKELNKNGTYNVIFEGVAEGDLINGKIRGNSNRFLSTCRNLERKWQKQ